ncbi:MAG: hypothetical protein ACE5JM_14575 [Armatimonadota bacterium]
MRVLARRGLVCAMVTFGALTASGPSPAGPRILPDEELLRCLPPGARIARIPSVFTRQRRVKQWRQGVVAADTDADGRKELVVAYYTPPHEYVAKGREDRKPREGFSQRAHVRVLEWDGTTWREQWDSGGWGMEFRARMPTEVVEAKPKTQRAYTRCLFGVRDINGDGRADILFTRSSFLAEGDRFEAWTWDQAKYRRIASCSGVVRIDEGRIVAEYGDRGIKLPRPRHLVWDGTQFVQEHTAKRR